MSAQTLALIAALAVDARGLAVISGRYPDHAEAHEALAPASRIHVLADELRRLLEPAKMNGCQTARRARARLGRVRDLAEDLMDDARTPTGGPSHHRLSRSIVTELEDRAGLAAIAVLAVTAAELEGTAGPDNAPALGGVGAA